MSRSLFMFPVLTLLSVWAIAMPTALAADPVKAVSSQLTVTASRCISPIPQLCLTSKVESRQVIVQAAESKVPESTEVAQSKPPAEDIKSFRILVTDFERKDNLGTIAEVQVTTQLNSQDDLSPGKFLAIPVQFDFSQATKSGEFNGSLVIEHSEGDLEIPVTLRIKDSLHLAIGVLGIGVLLAVGLASYQADGFDRDEVSSQVARLRSQIQLQMTGLNNVKRSVAEIFRDKVEAIASQCERHLDAKAWTEARKSLTEAQTVWDRWEQQQNDWLDLQQYVDQSLQTYLTDGSIPESTTANKELELNLSMTRRRMADCPTPEAFTELLKPLKEMFQRYLDASVQEKALDHLLRLAGEGAEAFREAVVDCKNELNRLSPSDEAAFNSWHEKAKKLQADLKQEIAKQAPTTTGNTRNAANRPIPIGVQALPKVSAIKADQNKADQDEAKKAQLRLKLYQGLGQGAMILLLCGIGLKQLYGASPTFGADPIADYTSLLAWGFSAEVTRDSVAKVLQRFQLPGSTEK